MRKRPHRTRRRNPIESLRLAIDCLPVATREAMLDGVRESDRIIAGAYVDERGGVCPMLAAHRRGGRTDLLSFARSWDRFARVGAKARAATARELEILTTQLEASLSSSTGLELDRAIREHRQLRGERLRGERLRRARHLLEGADPRGEIIARRLRKRLRRPLTAGRQAG